MPTDPGYELISSPAPMRPSPRCPQCGTALDGWTGIQGHEPKDGDFTVCAYCGAVGVFTHTAIGLLIRPPTRAERDQVAADPRMAAMQAAVAVIRLRRGAR